MATVELDPAGSDAGEIWQNALDLMGRLKGDWTLIGGLMVQLQLGALLLKSRSITKKDRDHDREDLIRLLACVQDPPALRAELRAGERRWLLRAETKLHLEDPSLTSLFGSDQIRLARTTYRLLVAVP